MQKIIPLKTAEDREFQLARLEYKRDPKPWNFLKFRNAYMKMEEAGGK